MPEVPRYKVVDAVRNRDGNVSGIFRRGAGHRPQVEQLLCEVGRILGRIEKGDPFERGQTGTGNSFIAGVVAMMRNSQNSQAQRALYFGHTDETIYLWRYLGSPNRK